jgi:hypothetical protein
LTIGHGLLTRRHALATIGAAWGALLSRGPVVAAGGEPAVEIARGRVFEDPIGDGACSARGRGIAGVMVSNGRDVVTTDSSGRWLLPVQSGDSVFVITPSQWTTGARGASAFSYLHQPGGTPAALRLGSPEIAPTGVLPASIDFGLRRQVQAPNFEALLFADTQAADAKELGYVRSMLLDATRRTDAAFAIHHGDVMGDDLTLFPDYRRIVDETGMTWHHCPGNHDMNLDTRDVRFAFEAWKRFMGPTNYAFQHGGVTFILLNNVEYLGHDAVTADGRAYRGRFGDDQLRFVANVLRNVAADDLVVVSMHVPLASFDNPDGAADTTSDRTALLRLLASRPNTVSFSGHSHTTEHHYFGRRDGFDRDGVHHHHVLTAACGSWWSGPCDAEGVPVADSRDGTPKGFHVLSIDGNRYATRFVAAGAVADPDMRVLVNGGDAEPRLLVDVFDGGPLTRVTYEIEGRPETTMALTRAGVADPYVVEAFERYRALCKPWVAAAPSSHMWSAALPENLRTQAKSLVVRVTGEYGRTFSRTVAVG